MKKVRIGIVGTGGICKCCHIPAYQDTDRAEVIALCDIIEERAMEVKEQFFPNAMVYTDYTQMIQEAAIDAVDICTPNYLHSDIAVAALNAGKHVFCEKPDAINEEEAIRMKKAAEANDKVLMVMRNNRWIASSQYLKRYIDEGKAGEIYAGRCGWVRRRGIPGKGGWFTSKAQSGGGPLIDLGVHMIDLAIWFMGNPRPVSVTGCTYCKFADDTADSDSIHSSFGDAKADGIFDVEDLAMGFIKFDNGACLQVECSWASNIGVEKPFVELRGTKAGIKWEHHGHQVAIFSEENGTVTDIHPRFGQVPNGHTPNLYHFFDVLLDGVTPAFKPQEGVNMMRILDAMYESAKTGREVLLDEK